MRNESEKKFYKILILKNSESQNEKHLDSQN